MIDDMTQITKEKLKYFFENNLEVHFKTINGDFRNGYVLGFEDNIVKLNERVLKEIPIHIKEIKPETIQKSIKK